jgi:uncharacterized radical SAM superfamily Fe-S cluster-containing enzyme
MRRIVSAIGKKARCCALDYWKDKHPYDFDSIPYESEVKQDMSIASRKPFLIRHIKRWWDLQTMIQLEWMQIEVTTRCNASCYYCPRTTYRNCWDNRDLSFENFKTLLPIIAYTKMVHLQGWGEPFLHPHLFEMIVLAKKTGCKVGTTTNGMLLNRRRIDQLVKSGIDHVAFSLTGIGEKNDQVVTERNSHGYFRLFPILPRKKRRCGLRRRPSVSLIFYSDHTCRTSIRLSRRLRRLEHSKWSSASSILSHTKIFGTSV